MNRLSSKSLSDDLDLTMDAVVGVGQLVADLEKKTDRMENRRIQSLFPKGAGGVSSAWLQTALNSEKFKQAAGSGRYFDEEVSFECPLPPQLSAKAAGDPITATSFGLRDYAPGIDQHPATPSGVLGFLTRQTVAVGTVRVARPTSPPTGAAAFIAEAAVKPEVQFRWTFVDVDLKTCAVWGAVSKNALQDVQSLQSALERDLSNAILSSVAGEVINGPTSADGFTGILATSGIQSVTGPGTSMLDQILAGIALVENSGNGPVNGIVLNSTDYATLAGSKLTSGSYNFPPGVSLPPIVRDSHLAAGMGLVANWSVVELLQRNGMTVIVGLKNDDITRNLATMRVDFRCALAISRPAAIAKVAFV